ncbi:hypothetical protein E5Q_04256 [Mixia osmundae IAM 14324]|uniref:30S ribosomal protein S15 n=2 Tax=Mixia osmundae (strain CBS 9802 / IAM 14324 / JCM 22182 / KY 12970) TaxID=764103 RepID=G7E418_MIXOS|nr:hypothetical protein E5Q_04256 [Mixia osmundae IAM 14324]
MYGTSIATRLVRGNSTSLAAASTSMLPLTSPFSTSASINRESRKKRLAREKRKANLEAREKRSRLLEATRPDPVLGYPPGKSDIWTQSELAQLIVRRDELWSTAPEADQETKQYNFGLQAEEAELLFRDLPGVAAQRSFLGEVTFEAAAIEQQEAVLKVEEGKKDNLQRILDLRNANSKGINFENRRRIVQAFSGEQPDNTGSPAVQAALLTYRIHNIASHMSSNRGDVHNHRALRTLVHQRQKIFKYLRRKDNESYLDTLRRVGLDARAVEGEITM